MDLAYNVKLSDLLTMMNVIDFIFSYPYMSSEQLAGLSNYVYSAIDSSPISRYIMHPFWNYVVQFMPVWIAPNLMTFCGFNFLLLGCMTLAFYDPSFNAYAPSHVYENHCSSLWIFMMTVQFLSHTLDGIDGKQARRLKCSSALGELFDHGLDSWACGLFPLPFFSVISSSAPWGLNPLSMHFFLWLIYLSFFFSHWEKYNTGVLYLPWSYDICMMLLTLCYFLVAMFTPTLFWFHFPVIQVTFSVGIFIALMIGVLGLSFPISAYNIRLAFERGHNIWNSYFEILRPFLSMFVLFTASTFWAICSNNLIIKSQPRMFFFATCTTYSSLVCRLIVAQMSKTKCKPFNLSLIPYLISLSISCFTNISNVNELRLLTAYTIYITVAHAHYGICVVRQIAKYFDIPVFYTEIMGDTVSKLNKRKQMIVWMILLSYCTAVVTSLSVNIVISSIPVAISYAHTQYSAYYSKLEYEHGDFQKLLVTDKYLFVGGRDLIFRLSLLDISDRHSQKHIKPSIRPTLLRRTECLKFKGRTPSDCSNHVRLLIPVMNDTLLVCGTNAFKPTVYRINRDLKYVASPSFQKGYCSPNPKYQSVAVWSEEHNPDNLPMLYVGSVIDAANTESTVHRSSIDSERSYFMATPKFQTNWLFSPVFVDSFDIGDAILFFANERLMTTSSLIVDMNIPIVMQVCKRDVGGNATMINEWTTFKKARLYCGYNNISDSLSFNHLDSVLQINPDRFDAIFSVKFGVETISVICSYTLDAIRETLHPDKKCSSKDYHQPIHLSESDAEALKQSALSSKYVRPEILNVKEKSSIIFKLNALVSTAIFVKSMRNINDKSVIDDLPLIYLATDQGLLYKLFQPSNHDEYQVLSVWTPMRNPFAIQCIACLVTVTESFLYVGGVNTIFQLSISNCEIYMTCLTCESDPFCQWVTSKESHSSKHQAIRRRGYCSSIKSPKSQVNKGDKCNENDRRSQTINQIHAYLIIPVNNPAVSSIIDGVYTCHIHDEIVKRYAVSNSNISLATRISDRNGCITDKHYIEMYKQWCRELDSYQQAYQEWTQLLIQGRKCVKGSMKNAY
ncbi:hypothetical protein GJ496_010100 [Pomphorhynchus laevis]|nr:hypothetical protein GJ496_010100 [Pomphorhynchus laevis]